MNDASQTTDQVSTDAVLEVAPQPAPPPLPTVGEMLIAAREAKGVSAGDVARTLRLGLRQIEALEGNRFEVLPGHTFIRGFLRNYAKVVGADAEAFLQAYERSRPQPAVAEIVAPTEQIDYMRKPTPRWVWYALGGVVLAIMVPVLIYVALRDDGAPVRPATSVVTAPAPVVSPVTPVLAPATGASQIALPLPAIAPVPSGEPVVPPGDQPGAPSGQAPTGTAANVPAGPAASTAAPPLAQPSLTLRFNGDAWVEIRDKSGNKVFSQLGRSGTEAPVHGTPPFAFVIGNAAQVTVIYKGKPVDLAPYVKVNVARFNLE